MKTRFLLILPPHRTDFGMWNYERWWLHLFPPLGLLAIASYLKQHGHAVKIIDCRELIWSLKTDDYLPVIAAEVRAFKPDYIGLNMLTSLFPEAKNLAGHLKKNFPELTILAGGPHPSVEPELTLRQIEGLDAVCVGAGEEVCLDLAEGKAPADVHGLMVRDKLERYVFREPEANLDKYPFPDFSLIKVEHYSSFSAHTTYGWLSKSLSVLTARSCPFACQFCATKWLSPFRMNSAEYVINLVDYLATFDINTVFMADDTFGASRKRLEQVCEAFLRSGHFLPKGRLRWRCHMRADQVEPEILQLMKSAGCFQIGLGFESGSDRMLGLFDKRTSVEQNRQASALIKATGMDQSASFIIGAPGETEEDALATFEMMQSLGINSVGIGNFRPLPGSPLYDQLLREGVIDKNTVDWAELGDFSSPPTRSYARYPLEQLQKLLQKGLGMAYGKQWVGVHSDIAADCPPAILEGVGKAHGIRIVAPPQFGSPGEEPQEGPESAVCPEPAARPAHGQSLQLRPASFPKSAAQLWPPSIVQRFTPWPGSGSTVEAVDSVVSGVLITTPAAQWAYAAEVPVDVSQPGAAGYCASLVVQVLEGAVAIAALDTADGLVCQEVFEGDCACGATALEFPATKNVARLMVRNASPAGPSKVLVHGAGLYALESAPSSLPDPQRMLYPWGDGGPWCILAMRSVRAETECIRAAALLPGAPQPLLVACQTCEIAEMVCGPNVEAISIEDLVPRKIPVAVVPSSGAEHMAEAVLRRLCKGTGHACDLFDPCRVSETAVRSFPLRYRDVRLSLHPTVLVPTLFSNWSFINHLLGLMRGRPGLKVLDMFAGSGAIGLCLAREGKPDFVDFSDVNFWAVRSIREGKELNGITVGQVWLSEGWQGIPEGQRYDLIVGNPPHHAEMELSAPGKLPGADPAWGVHHEFFREAHKRLEPGGRIVFVESALSASLRDFYETLAVRHPQYVVDRITPLPNNRAYYFIEIVLAQGSGAR